MEGKITTRNNRNPPIGFFFSLLTAPGPLYPPAANGSLFRIYLNQDDVVVHHVVVVERLEKARVAGEGHGVGGSGGVARVEVVMLEDTVRPGVDKPRTVGHENVFES